MNYKHLNYFWVIANMGSVSKASEQLHLTPQTLSGQLGKLEDDFGMRLFTRSGRNLLLNDAGRMVYGYANDIFTRGVELEETLQNYPDNPPLPIKVGIVDVVPKTIAYNLLRPALQLRKSVRISCREGELRELLSALAIHKIDLIIADSPAPKSLNVKCFNHKLGECGITFFATKKLAKIYEGDFPRVLDGAPMLLPTMHSTIRAKIMQWFEEHQIRPRIVAEFDDSALMKTFGQSGAGIFIAPTVIEADIEEQYRMKTIGRAEEVIDQFFAISVERKLTHPAVVAITNMARDELFK